MPKWLKSLLIVAGSIVLVGAAIYGILRLVKSRSASEVRVIPVTEASTSYSGADQSETEGEVTTDRIQSVYVSQTQQVTEVYVQEGQSVQVGDPILAFDTTLSDLELERKRIDIEQLKLDIENAQKERREMDTYSVYSTSSSASTTNRDDRELESVVTPYLRKGTGTVDDPYIFLWGEFDVYSSSFLINRIFDGSFKDALLPTIPTVTEPPVTTETPTTETPTTETPTTETPTTETPTTETPTTETPTTETPTTETPTTETPTTETPTTETPTTETPTTETPTTETPTTETPTTETPTTETPTTETPTTETPTTETPTTETPTTETPTTETPTTETPTTETPTTETPTTETPTTETPTTETPTPTATPQPADSTVRYAIFERREADSPQGELLDVWQMVFEVGKDGMVTFTMGDPDPDYDSSAVVDEPVYDYGAVSGPAYTWSELQKMKAEQDRKIIDLQFKLKTAELEYETVEYELSNGVVYSKIDGVVKTVRTVEDALAENQPLVLVSGGGGYYVQGYMGELDLETMQVGDTVDVMSWQSGESMTGTITEISDYPLSDDDYGYYWSQGNNNISKYPFTIFLDEDSPLREGEYVNITFTPGESAEDSGRKLYLYNPFLRQENGLSYVYVQGEDDLLEKRYVTTGKNLWGSYMEIKSGLTEDEFIAFPYGKSVVEGAKTVQGSMDDLYGDYY